MTNNNSNKPRHTPTARLTSIFAKADNELAKKRERRSKRYRTDDNEKHSK